MADGYSPESSRAPALTFVVARSENGIIGRQNRLPWHIPTDLQHFKRKTMGRPVVMGRKTFESIGKALPRRTNIVVTRDPSWQAPGAVVAHDIPSALALAYEEAHRTGSDEVAVIGGGELFKELLPQVRRIYLTEVHDAFDGDVVFDLDLALGWREVARERHAAETPGGPDFSFVTLERTG